MYKQANIIDVDNVISLIKTGRVVVRNVKNSQVYDVYGIINGNVYSKKPTISFENNWAEKTYILYIGGETVDSADYSTDYETMPECKEMARVLGACIERCRIQNEMTLSGNDVLEYRKSMFDKILQKMRVGNVRNN